MQPDDLDVIAPQGREVRIGQQTFTLRPLTIGQIPPLMRALKQVTETLDGSPIDVGNLGAAQLITLAADHGDTLIDAVVVATGQPLEVIASGTLDEFVDLFAQVVELNSDFFVQRVLPHFQATLRRARAKAATQAPAGRGPIPLRR